MTRKHSDMLKQYFYSGHRILYNTYTILKFSIVNESTFPIRPTIEFYDNSDNLIKLALDDVNVEDIIVFPLITPIYNWFN